MADLSWIDPLFKNARSAFGLDPKAAAEGQLMQKHGDLYTAQTETEKYRLGQLLPAQKGVFDADAGHKTALAAGVTLKNKGAQAAADFLADDKNYITTADGRRVPDPTKLSALFSSASLSAGDKTIQHLPGFVGGMNLQVNPLSPGANLAAGGTNATAGASMLKPIQLNPDQTLIQMDRLTGQPITGVPATTPKVTLPNFSGPIVGPLPKNAEVLPRGSISDADLAAILAPGNKAAMDKLGIQMPQGGNSTLPYTAPASSTKLQVADKNNAADLTEALLDNQTKLDIAIGRNATAKEIADIRKEGQEIVARIRAGKGKGASASAGGGLGDGSEVVDPLSLNRLGEREKDAILAITNGFGKSGHEINANQAALLAAAATTSFPNDPAHVAVQKFMAQNGITSDTGGWSRVDFKNADGSPVDFNALRQKLFGAKPAEAGPAASATGAPATPAVGGGAAATPGSSVAGVVANGATPSGGPAKKADGSIEIEGIPFTPGSNLATERKHGDKYTGLSKTTGKIETRYWDAEALGGKGGWSDTPIGGRQEDFDKVGELEKTAQRRSTKGWNLPASAEDAKGAEDELLKLAVEKGALSPEEYDAVTKFGQVSGSKRSTALRVVEKLKAMEGEEAKRDPRIKSYAKGDFLDDKGIPDDALELAERLGIDRAAYGLPQKVDYSRNGTNIAGNLYDDLKGSPLGAVFTPIAYANERDAIESGLKAFFTDLQAGKVKTSPQPRNDVPPVAGPAGSKTEVAPELPADKKIVPPVVGLKGSKSETKAESGPEAGPETKPRSEVPPVSGVKGSKPKSVADVVAPKKELTDEEKRILSGKGFGKAQKDEVAAKQKK